MGAFNHYVIVKFNDGVAVEELIQGLEKMISGIEHVKSFEWYAFILCFNSRYIVMFFPLSQE